MLQIAAFLGFESPQMLQTRLAGRGALHTLSLAALPGLGALQALLIKALLGLGTCWSWNGGEDETSLNHNGQDGHGYNVSAG